MTACGSSSDDGEHGYLLEEETTTAFMGGLCGQKY